MARRDTRESHHGLSRRPAVRSWRMASLNPACRTLGRVRTCLLSCVCPWVGMMIRSQTTRRWNTSFYEVRGCTRVAFTADLTVGASTNGSLASGYSQDWPPCGLHGCALG